MHILGPDRQTDGQTHTHSRQNLYILVLQAVTNNMIDSIDDMVCAREQKFKVHSSMSCHT